MRLVLSFMLLALIAYVSCTGVENKTDRSKYFDSYTVTVYDQPIIRTELGQVLKIIDDNNIFLLVKNKYRTGEANYATYTIMTATAVGMALAKTDERLPEQPDDEFIPILAPMTIVGYSRPKPETIIGNDRNWINLKIIDPARDSIGRTSLGIPFQTISPAGYVELESSDSVTIQTPLPGDYMIIVYAEWDAPDNAAYGIGIRIDGSLMSIIVDNKDLPMVEDTTKL